MKVDMSPAAVTVRLKRVAQLRRLCLALGKAAPAVPAPSASIPKPEGEVALPNVIEPELTDRACAPVVLFTGPPAAGKSTLATALLPAMQGRWPVEILDGDEVRLWLSEGLGFSRADRDRNIARIARVACLLARNGVAVLVAVVAPYAAARAQARTLATSQAIPFFEVFVSAPLAVLTLRDPKGMYRRAQAGEIANFTGLTDPYEQPEHPDLVIHTEVESVSASADRVAAGLRSRGLI